MELLLGKHSRSNYAATVACLQKRIENITEEQLEMHKSSVKEKLLVTPKDYIGMSNKLWREIADRTYLFDRSERQVKDLNSITRTELLAFYEVR